MNLIALFDQAADLNTAQRGEFLAELANRDAVIARALERLLAAEKSSVLAEPSIAALRSIATELTAAAPKTVGGFQLLRPLGSGGMGEVWLAERSAGAAIQQVALKMLRFDMGSDDSRLRFQLEQKVIASMNHPFIARMIDANHGPGELELPWIAMEYVDGLNLVEWCQHYKLSVRARIELIIKVLEAVAHAHQHLVVHRDLKSSNVMVTREGVPKLLDFGIAKHMGDVKQTATAQRFFSVGSVAPEQYTGARTTVATDVYQVGLLLYELLSGVPAYNLAGLAPAKIQELVLHRAPELPSRVADAQHAAFCSLERLSQLQRSLAGELDRIVMYALRKNPTERYSSAIEFARDLRNFLEGRPVLAVGQSKWYQTRKFLSRHWLPSSLAGLAMLATMALMLQLLMRDSALTSAREQAFLARDVATKERDKAQNVNAFLIDLFRAASPTASNKKDLSSIVLDAIQLQISRQQYAEDPSAAFALVGAALGLGEIAQAKRLLNAMSTQQKLYSADERRQLLFLQASLANIEADFPRLKTINALLAKDIRAASTLQHIMFIGYVAQTLVNSDPQRVLSFTALEPLPASLIRLRARSYIALKNYPAAIAMLVKARQRKDLTAMEHLAVLQSLTFSYSANKQDAQALTASAALIASAELNLGAKNPRLIPFWNTRANALIQNGLYAQAISIYDELLKWEGMSEKVRFILRMNRLLAATSLPNIEEQSKQLAWDFWRKRATLNTTSRAYVKIALLRVLAAEQNMPQARTIAAMPDVIDELEEPVVTELRVWREVLTSEPQRPGAREHWRTELQNVDSRDTHLRALTQR